MVVKKAWTGKLALYKTPYVKMRFFAAGDNTEPGRVGWWRWLGEVCLRWIGSLIALHTHMYVVWALCTLLSMFLLWFSVPRWIAFTFPGQLTQPELLQLAGGCFDYEIESFWMHMTHYRCNAAWSDWHIFRLTAGESCFYVNESVLPEDYKAFGIQCYRQAWHVVSDRWVQPWIDTIYDYYYYCRIIHLLIEMLALLITRAWWSVGLRVELVYKGV
jgi:hypothetical protein